ncbi:MAG: 16S rRNA (cytosine(1402)-N(4))-methyltransferase RsmH, partial [Thermovirgaceae bacterium]
MDFKEMHQTVMLQETLEWLAVRPGGCYLDGTLGGGGHAEAILQTGDASTRLLGLDRDPAALERAGSRLAAFGEQVTLVHANFADLASVAGEQGFTEFHGIVLDLGMSSFQLDTAGRGFSFMQDGPLDMRMDPTRGITAAELLQRYGDDWQGLADLLRTWGEERQATRVAKALVAAGREKPLETTLELA